MLGNLIWKSLRRRASRGMLVDFGWMSAQREVAAAEAETQFAPTQEAYRQIVLALQQRAGMAETREFRHAHEAVARLVHAAAHLH